jgi:type VI secretion system protein VasD
MISAMPTREGGLIMTDRRMILCGGGALGLLTLAGCGGGGAAEPPPPPAAVGPAAVTVEATGAAGMNPGPDGTDRPLTLTVLQLRATPTFERTDFLALQSPEGALGADLISATRVALAPGGTAAAVIPLDPTTTAIGVIGGYRDPAGKVFRVVVPVTAGQSATLAVGVTASGLTARQA